MMSSSAKDSTLLWIETVAGLRANLEGFELGISQRRPIYGT
jgi:hypothetical protein